MTRPKTRHACETSRRGAIFLAVLARLTDHNPRLAARVRRRHRHGERLAHAAQHPTIRLDAADCTLLDSAHDHLIFTVVTAVHPAVVAPILGLPPAHATTRARGRRAEAA